ncbi:unnamed protein product, partial [Sphacelaria rigidula]
FCFSLLCSISYLSFFFSLFFCVYFLCFWGGMGDYRSLEGISVRGMLVNLFFQVVIFLYLMDNDTTSMVLMTNAIGLAIEVTLAGFPTE